MLFSVRHRTLYAYSAPVRLGDHLLRLRPRQTGVRIVRENLRIEPAPASQTERVDRYGNRTTKVAFAGETDRLLIDSRFELETDPAPRPWLDEREIRAEFGGGAGPLVRAYAAELFARTGGDALTFLDALNSDLFARTDRKIRDVGYAQDPEETLSRARGACRDLTLLFMAAARSQNIPARFVSGYQAHAETPDGKRHLHAWPEVFLPGAGWRGYDPTHGCAAASGHVALCAGADQRSTMPVEGGYFGDGATSTLRFDLDIRVGDGRV